MAFDDDDDEGYFSEVEEGEDTGRHPKFWKQAELDIPPAELAQKKVDELVTMYIALRNQLTTDRRGFDARKARIKTFMSMISMTLRDRADQIGTDSFKGSYGTAYRNRKEKFTIQDWTSFQDYLNRTGNLHLMQKRLSPNAVKEVRSTDGELPPGVSVFEEIEFAVRSPSARSKS